MSRPSFSCRIMWGSLIHIQLESLIGMPKDIWKYNGPKLYTHKCEKLNDLKHRILKKEY